MNLLNALVIYDSITGNTKRMADAVCEGLSSCEELVVEIRKVGEPFPLTVLTDADVAVFGSPVIYADISEHLRSFLESLECCVAAGRIKLTGKTAAVFGSYGYDGGWVMEGRLKNRLRKLGYNVMDKVCMETDSSIRYDPNSSLKNCQEFGRQIARTLVAR